MTSTGEIGLSSPEATALDLVRYPEHAGSLSNVAMVLRELAEYPEAEAAHAYAQGLGYLLDRIVCAELAAPLMEWLQGGAPV